MRKYPAILLAVLLLLAACSAEIVTQLPDEPVKEDSGSVFVEAVSGNQIRVGFTPVAFADSYSYVLGTEETKTPVSSYEMIDGNVSFVVESDMKGTITIYAEKEGEEPVRIASQNFDLSIAGLVPDVYISARTTDGVTLMLASGVNESITYKVDIYLRDGDFVKTEYLKAEDSAIHITGLEAESSYSLYVSQSLDGVNYSDANQIDVGAFSQDSNQTIEMTIFDDVLTATGITGTVANLYKTDSLSSSSTPVLVLENIKVTDGKATVEAKTSLKSLESGYFYFECDGAYSNVVKYVSPVHLEGVDDPVQENWKSALVAIDFADDVIPSDYRVSVKGASGASATIVDGGVMISNLDSNSEFNVTLNFSSTETLFSTELTGISGKTQSFAGTYQWEGTFQGKNGEVRFRIKVSDEVREGSTSPYYVYFDTTPEIGDSIINSTDSDGNSYVNQTLRIMPIVDYNVESGGDDSKNPVKTNAPGDLAEQNKAYLANSSKWNPMAGSSLGKVRTWYIVRDTVSTEKDKAVTVTVSEAGPSFYTMEAKMQTTFEFREAEVSGDIVPVIKFKNKDIGANKDTINGFLYKNPDLDAPSRFGDTTETEGQYCWYLEKVKEV